MKQLEQLLISTSGQHGFWLSNHIEIIESDLNELLSKHGLIKACSILNETGNPITSAIYKKIETVKDAVYSQEFNKNHEDDYYNAGGFFAHWSMYTAEEKTELLERVK